MHMNAFVYFLKKFLNDKYPHIDFDFYLSRRVQNVHMGLNYSLLTLREYEQIIPDIEELWIMKRHDMKFKFILPQLIHTAKWIFDYIIFRNILKMATVECKTYHSNAHIPRRAYQGSVGYDLTIFLLQTLKS